MPYNVLNCIPTNPESSLYFSVSYLHTISINSQHSLTNVVRRIIDICPTSVYTNQEPLLTPVIAEVTEGNDIMEEQFEIEEDLPARSGDRWMKR